jgi:hypothetical protein
MASRKDRLRNLLRVQEQLKAYHEMRHAGFVAQSQAAEAAAAEIMARAQGEASLSDLFPEVYARGLAREVERQQQNTAKAVEEASHVATQTARANIVERAWREARAQDERERAERDRLEAVLRLKSRS